MTTVVAQPFVSLGPQHPTEIRIITWDFTKWLRTGETISTAVVNSADSKSGADASGSMVTGSATINGKTVDQKITGGTIGRTYDLTCTITTSLGQTFALTGSMLIAIVRGVATA